MRQKLHAEKSISEQVWLESQNLAEKSKRDVENARDQLTALGLDAEAIERIGTETSDQKARLILGSPSDATIVEVAAQLGNVYDKKETLLVIDTKAAAARLKPALR